MPTSKTSSTTFRGHFSTQIPQPVQSAALTMRAFLRILTLKLPTDPLTSSSSE